MDCAFRKDEFTWIPAVGDVRDIVLRESQTSLIQLIFGPSVDKCTSYIWVQLDGLKCKWKSKLNSPEKIQFL